jgi:hypothetical protein
LTALDYENGSIGLGAYFAYQVGIFGPQLVHMRSHWVFIMEFVLFYFVVFFSFYAFIAGGTNGLKVF